VLALDVGRREPAHYRQDEERGERHEHKPRATGREPPPSRRVHCKLET
jgi:hypothetical protein